MAITPGTSSLIGAVAWALPRPEGQQQQQQEEEEEQEEQEQEEQEEQEQEADAVRGREWLAPPPQLFPHVSHSSHVSTRAPCPTLLNAGRRGSPALASGRS